ncbi:MAG: HAD family hydrolase [Chloroflexi bacterium]|nr:HAD family hydrolase [Chloroflexota bacterium]
MIELEIPGMGAYTWEYLVLDINGTLTTDGVLLPGVAERLQMLAARLSIRLLTSDTRGTAAGLAERLGLELTRTQPGGPTVDSRTNESAQKAAYVEALGAERVIAIGNGNNDALMLAAAGLGIAVLGDEGAAVAALAAADIAVRHINDALDLLIQPVRLVSTWRR